MSDNPNLGLRDLDDLKDAIRSLVVVVTRFDAALTRGIRDLLAALQQIATNTEGLPALVETLASHANGRQSLGVAATISAEDP
jgi:hypothetical protein